MFQTNTTGERITANVGNAIWDCDAGQIDTVRESVAWNLCYSAI